MAALVGLARQKPDSHVIKPFTEYFLQLVRNNDTSDSVVRLTESFCTLIAQKPQSHAATSIADQLKDDLHNNPNHPVVSQLTEELMALVAEQPNHPAVKRFTQMIESASDAGVAMFGRAVLNHSSLLSKTNTSELAHFVSAFNLSEARRAMARGLIDRLCAEDILRNKPRDGVLADIEKDLIERQQASGSG